MLLYRPVALKFLCDAFIHPSLSSNPRKLVNSIVSIVFPFSECHKIGIMTYSLIKLVSFIYKNVLTIPVCSRLDSSLVWAWNRILWSECTTVYFYSSSERHLDHI